MQEIKTNDEFTKEVKNSDIPVLVDFWAEWCGPCRMITPVLEELEGEYKGKVKFVKVNVDEANELASEFNVLSIPTIILFKNGEVIETQIGAGSKETYKTLLDE